MVNTNGEWRVIRANIETDTGKRLNLLSQEASVEAEKHFFAGYDLAEHGRFGDAIAEYHPGSG